MNSNSIESTKYFKEIKDFATKKVLKNVSRVLPRYYFTHTLAEFGIEDPDVVTISLVEIAYRQTNKFYQFDEYTRVQFCRGLLFAELTGCEFKELNSKEAQFMAQFVRAYALPLVEAGVLDKHALKYNSGKEGGDTYARSYLLSEEFYNAIIQSSAVKTPTKQEIEEFKFTACINGKGWGKDSSRLSEYLLTTKSKCKDIRHSIDMELFIKDMSLLGDQLFDLSTLQGVGERGWLYDNFINPIKDGERVLQYTSDDNYNKKVRATLMGRLGTLVTLKFNLNQDNKPQPYKVINLQNSGRIDFGVSLNSMPKELRKRYALVPPNHVLLDLDLSSAQLTLLCQKGFCNAPIMAEKLEELHANGKKVWDYIKTPLSKEIKKTITYGLVFGGTISDIVYSVNQKYGLGTVNKEVVLDVLSYFLDLPEAIENYLANLSDIDFEVKNACGKKFKFDEEVKNKPNAKRIKKEATLQKETKEKKARKYLAFQAQGMEAFYMSKIIAEAVGNELFAFIYDGFMVDLPIVTDKETTAKNYTNNIEAYINKHFPGMHITSEIIKPN